ncbi:MAG: GH3 auxin-responsive promoter family protein [Candidatus Pacebacteria bacterium]|nr:GH3 auxin-responsive promoter family protein [Candidatus Paceibacterota bacterium]
MSFIEKIKVFLVPFFAKYRIEKMMKWVSQPMKTQTRVIKELIKKGKQTNFGYAHDFEEILSIDDFQNQVPIRTYEDLKPYIDRVTQGESNVLWPGIPKYFATTSGTTSGKKYIPMTKESTPYHVDTALLSTLNYIHETGRAECMGGKIIFLQGSPVLQKISNIPLGRLSGIVAHHVPGFLQKNRLPTMEINSIEDWDAKLDAIVDQVIGEDLRIIGGIPSWIVGFFKKIIEKTGKPVGNVFPNFNLFVYGGLNYEPYRNQIEGLIGRAVDSIELFPASEGFFAFQDKQNDKGLLLQLNSGIFYEFIPMDSYGTENQKCLTIGEVEVGVDYALILTTNAGLWRYDIGDMVRFTSVNPYRIVVSGRTKHYISAFGEHVIGKEVEEAMLVAQKKAPSLVKEFTVAPMIQPENGLPYHQWCIEFIQEPADIHRFARILDLSIQSQNEYYRDLREGKTLDETKVTIVSIGTFDTYQKSIGKFGGQNKVKRLSNDRIMINELIKINN